MKQIESEKEMLLEGLQAVERARDWYRKQIAAVQDKIKYVCRMGSQVIFYFGNSHKLFNYSIFPIYM